MTKRAHRFLTMRSLFLKSNTAEGPFRPYRPGPVIPPIAPDTPALLAAPISNPPKPRKIYRVFLYPQSWARCRPAPDRKSSVDSFPRLWPIRSVSTLVHNPHEAVSVFPKIPFLSPITSIAQITFTGNTKVPQARFGTLWLSMYAKQEDGTLSYRSGYAKPFGSPSK